MRTNVEIINDARKAYERCFNDIHEMTKFENQDVMLDKETLMNEVKDMKKELMNRMNSLDVLKEKLTIEAEQAYEKTFGKEDQKPQMKMKTVDEEYKELEKNKENLMNWGKDLKSKVH